MCTLEMLRIYKDRTEHTLCTLARQRLIYKSEQTEHAMLVCEAKAQSVESMLWACVRVSMCASV